MAYLDDLAVAGNLQVLTGFINSLESEANRVGLSLNRKKCKLVTNGRIEN